MLQPKLWILIALAAIATSSGFLSYQASRDRGLTPAAVWLLDASEQRVDYYKSALWGGEGNARDRDFIERSFAPHGGLPALMPALVANAKASGYSQASSARMASTVNAVFFALLVLVVGLMGLEASGGVGALVAAVGAATVPRLFGLGAGVNFGMSALLLLTLTPYLLHRARYGLGASILALLSVALSVHVGVLGLFVWVPWLYLSFVRGHWPKRSDGLSLSPPFPLRLVVLIGLGLLIGVLAYPYIWHQSKAHLNIWLTHFLRQPSEPFSYAGELWGQKRVPWHLGPYLLAVTMPPTLLVLAFFGWRGTHWYTRLSEFKVLKWLRFLPFAPETDDARVSTGLTPLSSSRQELLRLAAFCLLLSLALPLILRTPYLGSVDLVALSVPWLLVFVAAGAERLVAVLVERFPLRGLFARRARPSWALASLQGAGLSVFVLLLVAPPVIELARLHPLHEAYYNWFIGGADGARIRSLPRYPQGPMPLALLERIGEHAEGRSVQLAFMLKGRNEHTLERSAREGLTKLPFVIRENVYEANVIIFHHDDLDPRYEDALTEFYRGEREDGELLLRYELDGVPIYSTTIVRSPVD